MKASYRILRSIHSLRKETGGPVAGLAEVTPLLAELGVLSDFAVLDGCAPVEAPFCNLPLHVFEAHNKYGSCPEFRGWLNDHLQNYDAVFVHGCWKYHAVAVREAALKQGIPYFLYPHGMLDPWFNRTYPLKWLKKQVYWCLREYQVVRDARAVLFTSQEEMRLARTAFKPYRAKGQVVPYGTRAPKATDEDNGRQFRESLGLAADTPYLLYLGRIHEKKGIDLLVDAWKRWKPSVGGAACDWQLVIAGPEGEPQHESLIAGKMKDCPDIHRTGGIFGAEKWSALSGALALALPSHQENFGMVVAEALSVSTPVMMTRQVNIWREVVESGAGFAGDDTVEGVEDVLGQLNSRWIEDPSLRYLRQSALECYHRNFCIEKMGVVFQALIHASLKTPKP